MARSLLLYELSSSRLISLCWLSPDFALRKFQVWLSLLEDCVTLHVLANSPPDFESDVWDFKRRPNEDFHLIIGRGWENIGYAQRYVKRRAQTDEQCSWRVTEWLLGAFCRLENLDCVRWRADLAKDRSSTSERES